MKEKKNKISLLNENIRYGEFLKTCVKDCYELENDNWGHFKGTLTSDVIEKYVDRAVIIWSKLNREFSYGTPDRNIIRDIILFHKYDRQRGNLEYNELFIKEEDGWFITMDFSQFWKDEPKTFKYQKEGWWGTGSKMCWVIYENGVRVSFVDFYKSLGFNSAPTDDIEYYSLENKWFNYLVNLESLKELFE